MITSSELNLGADREKARSADDWSSVDRPRIEAAVAIEAQHFCMKMRGVQKPCSKMVTSAMRGSFKTDAASRAEVMSLLGLK